MSNMSQSETQNFESLYKSVVEKVTSLLGPSEESLKDAILSNVVEIRSWLPEEGSQFNHKVRLHRSAFTALKSSLVILSAIANLSKQEKYHSAIHNNALVSQMFSGAHVLIEDDGEFLNNLKTITDLSERSSSHYRKDKKKHKIKCDYSIRAEVIFNELLIGKVIRDGKTYTWFQFEAHAHQSRTAYRNSLIQLLDNFLQLFNYSIEKLRHHVDFLTYVWHGKKRNIGQYGHSLFTESNPILLEKRVEQDMPSRVSLGITSY